MSEGRTAPTSSSSPRSVSKLSFCLSLCNVYVCLSVYNVNLSVIVSVSLCLSRLSVSRQSLVCLSLSVCD